MGVIVAVAWIVFLGCCVYWFYRYKVAKINKRCNCTGLSDPHGLMGK